MNLPNIVTRDEWLEEGRQEYKGNSMHGGENSWIRYHDAYGAEGNGPCCFDQGRGGYRERPNAELRKSLLCQEKANLARTLHPMV
jgi:hypothetical protein